MERAKELRLSRVGLIENLVHGNPHMAFLVHAFAVLDQEHLGRFVLNVENVSDLIGKRPVNDKVEEIEIDISRLGNFLQPLQGNGTDRTARTVLENNLGPELGVGNDLF